MSGHKEKLDHKCDPQLPDTNAYIVTALPLFPSLFGSIFLEPLLVTSYIDANKRQYPGVSSIKLTNIQVI